MRYLKREELPLSGLIERIKNNKLAAIFEMFSLLIIIVCIFCSIRMNIVGRTLWLDEAMLAVSINTRDFIELLHAPLAWNQSAPVIYILIVKLFTVLFGNSEFVLRLFSIICYVALLFVFYILSKNALKIRLPLMATAVVANMAMLLEYSNMFKPYILDCLSVMLVLLVFYLYKEKKLNVAFSCVIIAVLIWASNPVAFFAGGVAAYEFLWGIISKNKRVILSGLAIGISALISFGIMYFVWLKPTVDATNLSDFWVDSKFPLITGIDKLIKAYDLSRFALSGLGTAWIALVILSLVALVINIVKKKNNPYVWVIAIAVVITLFASMVGFFPMSDRLFLFMDPVCYLMSLFAMKWIIDEVVKEKYITVILAVIFIVLIYLGHGFARYYTGEAYREGEEVNSTIEYLENNLKEDDQLYVYYAAIPIYQYKEGYEGVAPIGKCKNVIYGSGMLYNHQADGDVEYVSRQKDIYILYTHVVDYESRDDMESVLKSRGKYESVIDKYLYHYSAY